MSKLLTPQFRTNIAQQFHESLGEAANTIYYVAAHRSLPFANDTTPPAIDSSVYATYHEMYDNMLFGKHVAPDDVAFMTRHIPWETGIVYDAYDDKDHNLPEKKFFVVSRESDQYHVFKCLHNAGGMPSTDQPLFSETGPDDQIYILQDGYQWKYMYTISEIQWRKFATTQFIPVFPNADVSANAIPGTIDHIELLDGGSQNNNYANGTFKEISVASNNLIHSLESDTTVLSSNTDFYKNTSLYIVSGPGEGQLRNIVEYIVTGSERRIMIDHEFETLPGINSVFQISPRVIISGDGANCLARCEINPNGNTVQDIIVIDRGSDYTYADVQIIANTGLVGALTTTGADARAVISPPGGHGADVLSELYATRVGISVNFDGDERGTIPATNDYRLVSLIREPRFARAIMECNTISHSAPSSFIPGETVIQQDTGATGTVFNREATEITISNIRGFFETSNGVGNTATQLLVGQDSGAEAYIDTLDRTFKTFNQTQIFNVEVTYAGPDGKGFRYDEQVVQPGLSDVASNILKLTVNVDPLEFQEGEVVRQPDTGAEGVVSNRYNNQITLSNVGGSFTISNGSVNKIIGVNSGTLAAVEDIDNTVMANAVGTIYSLNNGGVNSNIIGLTNVNGNFALSDDETNTINTFRGQTSQAEAKLIGRSYSSNYLVDGSGDFLYIENFRPIQRANTQVEKIKLIIEF